MLFASDTIYVTGPTFDSLSFTEQAFDGADTVYLLSALDLPPLPTDSDLEAFTSGETIGPLLLAPAGQMYIRTCGRFHVIFQTTAVLNSSVVCVAVFGLIFDLRVGLSLVSVCRVSGRRWFGR